MITARAPGDREATEYRFAEAERLLELGRPAEALEGYRRLLAARLAGHARAGTRLDAADVVVVERLADLAVLFGEHRAADGLLEGMAGTLSAAGNHAGADYATLKRAHAALESGRMRHAFAVLRQVEPSTGVLEEIDFTAGGLEDWETRCRWRAVDGVEAAVLFTRFYLAAGRLLAGLGSYACAECSLRRGLEHAGGGAPEVAALAAVPLRLALAGALLERGDLAAAAEVLEHAAAGVDARMDPGLAVQRLELQARLDLLRGELGRAVEGLRQVARICRAGGFRGPAAAARVNLAHVLIVLNQTRAARGLLKAARREARAAGDRETVARAAWLRRVAMARGQSLAPRVLSVTESWGGAAEPAGSSDAARAPALPEPESHLSLFDDLALAFHWELGRWQLDAAGRRLEEMGRVFAGCDSEVVRLRLAVLAAVLAYYRGDAHAAEAGLRGAVPRLRELGLKPDEWQAQRFLGWCAAQRGRQREAAHASARASALLDQLTGSLSAADRVFFLLNKWTAEEERLAREVDGLLRLRAGAEARGGWSPRLRWRLASGIDRLLERIDRHHEEAALRRIRGDGDEGGAAGDVRRSLWTRLLTHPRDRATVVFLVLPDRVVTMVSGWMMLDLSVAPFTRLRVRQVVSRWHELASRMVDADPAETADARAALVDELATGLGLPALLERLPRRVRALTVVADDALHGFPFAAVRHRGRHLVEGYAVTQAFSSRPPARTRRGGVGSALLAGVAGVPQAEGSLPSAARELDALEALLRGEGVPWRRMDEQAGRPASREAVMAALPQAGLFHVACHGTFEPDRPDRSGLLLQPGPGAEETLSLRDLSGLRLEGVRHATLSSCWSADSYVLPGRWIVSLPEALCRAGVGGVLTSVWGVDDEVGRCLQAGFYQGVAARLPRDEALRRVQLAAAQGRLPGCERPCTADPVWWAGLRLYGDPGPLTFASR